MATAPLPLSTTFPRERRWTAASQIRVEHRDGGGEIKTLAVPIGCGGVRANLDDLTL
jgi:hypothetical protein